MPPTNDTSVRVNDDVKRKLDILRVHWGYDTASDTIEALIGQLDINWDVVDQAIPPETNSSE